MATLQRNHTCEDKRHKKHQQQLGRQWGSEGHITKNLGLTIIYTTTNSFAFASIQEDLLQGATTPVTKEKALWIPVAPKAAVAEYNRTPPKERMRQGFGNTAPKETTKCPGFGNPTTNRATPYEAKRRRSKKIADHEEEAIKGRLQEEPIKRIQYWGKKNCDRRLKHLQTNGGEGEPAEAVRSAN